MDSNMSKGMCPPCAIAMILVIVGALNWGLVGLGGFFEADWNLVRMLLGSWPTVEWIVYILVGVAGLWLILSWSKCCIGTCSRKGPGSM